MDAAKNPPAESATDREIVSTRSFAATREHMFAAFSDPGQLTQWWGPAGFTTTFQEFDFRPGGRWRLFLHGPDGSDYPNEKEFIEVLPPQRISFRHIDRTHGFQMTLDHAQRGDRTWVTWRMLFDSAAECAKIRDLVLAANEQNFDRLETHLATLSSPKP